MSFISSDITPDLYDLFMGSILHDIGKLYIRTNDSTIRSHIKSHYGSTAHQFWGDYFLLKHAKNISGRVQRIVENHHDCSTNDIYEMIVAIADKLSANEREEHKLKGDDEIDNSVMQLISVFCDINTDISKKFEDTYYKKPITRNVLNFAEKEISTNINDEYKKLFGQFEKAFDKIYSEYGEDKYLFSHYLYHLIENYTFNIPSAYYYNRPSISLWAHLKTTAAIALALYNQLKAEFSEEADGETRIKKQLESILNKFGTPSVIKEDEYPYFTIVKGDVSGIQDFVYDTDMDGASNALKGKSFYISFLMDTIARFIAGNENLSAANILMCGGGHFYILAPRVTMARIQEYQDYLDRIMFKAHGGKLSVLLACVPVSIYDFLTQDKSKNTAGNYERSSNISIKFRDVSAAIQSKKFQKYRGLISKKGVKFFGPEDDYTDKCPRCSRKTIARDSESFCPFCDSFICLGKELAKRKYLCSSFKRMARIKIARGLDEANQISDVLDVFACFGRDVEFIDEIVNSQHSRGKVFYALKIRNDDSPYPTLSISTSVPVEENEHGEKALKNLDFIAKVSKGIDAWAVLRGDVDNLGSIFTKGLGENPPFSKVITLSEEFSVFFSLYLDQIINHNEKWRENTIVLYAGGDDFCLIGPWSEIPKVAYRIRQDFTRYTHGNPALTISMGFEISPDIKYPVYRVAQASGENLDKAKSYVHGDGSAKNCLAFSEHIVRWNDYAELESIKDKLADLIENGNVSKALLNIIYSITSLKETANKKNEIFKAWRFFYAMKRLIERSRKEVEGKLREIVDIMIDKKDNTLYEHAYLAARWSEFEIRE